MTKSMTMIQTLRLLFRAYGNFKNDVRTGYILIARSSYYCPEMKKMVLNDVGFAVSTDSNILTLFWGHRSAPCKVDLDRLYSLFSMELRAAFSPTQDGDSLMIFGYTYTVLHEKRPNLTLTHTATSDEYRLDLQSS